jgi:hypothetical protein
MAVTSCHGGITHHLTLTIHTFQLSSCKVPVSDLEFLLDGGGPDHTFEVQLSWTVDDVLQLVRLKAADLPDELDVAVGTTSVLNG